jgi:hypothetical protein
MLACSKGIKHSLVFVPVRAPVLPNHKTETKPELKNFWL